MASAFGPLLLICNPRAGSGAAKDDLVELRRHLDARELEHEVVFTVRRGHANGMIEDDAPVRGDAVLGIAASGTASDFVKTFGIPPLPAHAAVHLDGPESFPIDIGKVTYQRDQGRETRYFCNVAEAGLGAVVARRAGTLPRRLGPLLYPLALWLALMPHPQVNVKVDLVDSTY